MAVKQEGICAKLHPTKVAKLYEITMEKTWVVWTFGAKVKQIHGVMVELMSLVVLESTNQVLQELFNLIILE